MSEKKPEETLETIMKKAGFNLAARRDVGMRRSLCVSANRKLPPSCKPKVQALSTEESKALLAAQSQRSNVQRTSRSNPVSQSHRTAPVRDRRPVTQQNLGTQVTSPLEKAADKVIGAIPGVQVGATYRFKSDMVDSGLHQNVPGGIDFVRRGPKLLATSICLSDSSGYKDRIADCYDCITYIGEGGNVTSKDASLVRDQKLVRGNLALANCMEENSPVRVIHGTTKYDLQGNRFKYIGLYLVKDFWAEQVRGKLVYKFKLFRILGQPAIV